MATSSRLPENLTIEIDKITAYLLNPANTDGWSKAKYFSSYGFTIEASQLFAQALFDHAATTNFESVVDTLYGRRFVFEGPLTAPRGKTGRVRTIWEVGPDEDIGRLVTAYPC